MGEQSFKHADVLSEKINFSAPGGPKSTIFDTDDVDPLYFEVSIVLAPPDPPYMSKNSSERLTESILDSVNSSTC